MKSSSVLGLKMQEASIIDFETIEDKAKLIGVGVQDSCGKSAS